MSRHPKGTCEMRVGWIFSAIFEYVVISRKRCILHTTLLWDGNRKPYASYRMVSLSMTLSDPWPGIQGHGSFKRRVYPKRRILQTQLLYSTLIGSNRHVSIGKLAIQLTTPLLLRKPCKLFASVARVCQRQLAYLVRNRIPHCFGFLSARNHQSNFTATKARWQNQMPLFTWTLCTSVTVLHIRFDSTCCQ